MVSGFRLSSLFLFLVCLAVWLAFFAICLIYKNAADGKSGIAKPIIQTIIAAFNGLPFSRFYFQFLSATLNNKAAEFFTAKPTK
ncbi:hypothetical protein CJ307_32380 [Klebsiella quasipneumoniae]|nr:hypothetical protein CJ307_32380 [Klebsiella quasipneumoniae]